MASKFLPSLLRSITSLAAIYCSSGPLVVFPARAVENNFIKSIAEDNPSSSLHIVPSPFRCEGTIVKPLNRIGSGGSGTVYQSVVTSSSSSSRIKSGDEVVVKIANAGSNDRLDNECSVLNHLSSFDAASGFERFIYYVYSFSQVLLYC